MDQLVAKSPKKAELIEALGYRNEVGGAVGAAKRDLARLAHEAHLDDEWRGLSEWAPKED